MKKTASHQTNRAKLWVEAREYSPEKLALARQVLQAVRDGVEVFEAIRLHPLPDGEGYMGKNVLVAAYRQGVKSGAWKEDQTFLAQIRMKPMRTLSGVTTVTVLTKPYPCPGKCIFCPDDVRMPKSYLPDEPGAMRGLFHAFDPYEQASARLHALYAVGHPVEKIELLVLGGTWSAYKRDYQEWFIKRCFDAMNESESSSLEEAQKINETSLRRNVGLVIETRPDHIDMEELIHLRKLGVTKVQIGAQNLDDDILLANKRGHTVEKLRESVELLRAGGFKIVLHWMPNLLGANVDSDREDFSRLWDGICPDELKIYPTQLLENTELHECWKKGEYTPYTTDELINLIADIKTTIPRYCRVNRIIRDIPSSNVVEGNKRTSLRQDIHLELKRRGESCQCIRCREVRGGAVSSGELTLHDLVYHSHNTEEHFLTFDSQEDKIIGFLRLSLPKNHLPTKISGELKNTAMIREVHVYGQSLRMGESVKGAAQHVGLGTKLIQRAEEIAREKGFAKIAVISAIGTKEYYAAKGFTVGDLYMIKTL